MPPSLRRLTPLDAALYRRLMLRAYALHPDAFTSTETERSALPLAWWESRLRAADDAPEVVFGAFSEDGVLAGVAGVSFESREKTRHKSTLFGMFVHPEFRGGSIGMELVEAVLTHARARRTPEVIQLTVTEGNAPAQRLYVKCGFRPFGVEPFAVRVGAGFVSKVHMWRMLTEEVGTRL